MYEDKDWNGSNKEKTRQFQLLLIKHLIDKGLLPKNPTILSLAGKNFLMERKLIQENLVSAKSITILEKNFQIFKEIEKQQKQESLEFNKLYFGKFHSKITEEIGYQDILDLDFCCGLKTAEKELIPYFQKIEEVTKLPKLFILSVVGYRDGIQDPKKFQRLQFIPNNFLFKINYNINNYYYEPIKIIEYYDTCPMIKYYYLLRERDTKLGNYLLYNWNIFSKIHDEYVLNKINRNYSGLFYSRYY